MPNAKPPPRNPEVVVDKHDRIFIALAGRPMGEGEARWRSVEAGVERALEAAEREVTAWNPPKCKDCRGGTWELRCSYHRNRRGDFASLNTGVSHGGGQHVRTMSSATACVTDSFVADV